MLVIPAIDLKNGKCVRLLQGISDRETVYSDDPAAMAQSFEDAGAKRLHLVDLDGAFKGKTANLQSIKQILKSIHIPVELGGGIRTLDDITRILDLGITSVIVGTMAVKDPEVLRTAFHQYSGDELILGIDSRAGKVAVEGWMENTELDDVVFGLDWRQHGVTRVIYTDIARDGMLSGPNTEGLRDFALKTGLKVTASGGISSHEDIDALKTLESIGVDSVITGKAVYEGKLDLKELFAC